MKYKTITQRHHNYYNHYTILYVSADDYGPRNRQTCVETELYVTLRKRVWMWYNL